MRARNGYQALGHKSNLMNTIQIKMMANNLEDCEIVVIFAEWSQKALENLDNLDNLETLEALENLK